MKLTVIAVGKIKEKYLKLEKQLTKEQQQFMV